MINDFSIFVYFLLRLVSQPNFPPLRVFRASISVTVSERLIKPAFHRHKFLQHFFMVNICIYYLYSFCVWFRVLFRFASLMCDFTLVHNFVVHACMYVYVYIYANVYGNYAWGQKSKITILVSDFGGQEINENICIYCKCVCLYVYLLILLNTHGIIYNHLYMFIFSYVSVTTSSSCLLLCS